MNSTLRIFDIPKELLDRLEPTEKQVERFINEEANEVTTEVTTEALERLQMLQEEGLRCRTCQTTFVSREEQRAHYSTDWHRYNLKVKFPIRLEEFEQLLSDLTESISGSEDEDEDDEDKEQDKVNAILSKQEQTKDKEEISVKPTIAPELKKHTALSWFKDKESPDMHYGVYRHLLSLSSLASFQQKQKKRYWTLLMVGGGHFAGCVIDVNASLLSDVKFIEHKTIHRYTTRRKQGGAQSANDNEKGKANSAGAQIRRYNEQMLQQEVRQIIAQWRERIQESEFVFVHAPSGNRKIIFGYDDAILARDNTKSIPFTTRRPTLNELKRVFIELITVKLIQVDERAIKEQEEKKRIQVENAKASKAINNKKEPEIEKNKADPAVERLLDIVKQNKTAITLNYIEKHPDLPISGRLPKELIKEDLRHYPTLLHLAASLGGAGDLVSELIRKYDADPTILNDVGKTAYEVSKDKETRNAFRRCMCDLPDKWKWLEEARVPSPLTKEQEQEQIAKEKKKQEKEQEKRRLLEIERAKMEAAREQQQQQDLSNKKNLASSSSRSLGGNMMNSDVVNMSPEARMRLEREKRARAAEERMKRLK
ncbi:hypothetical protein BCV72DRAFT_272677 [Rhizopus microsporus var. microsporus]|uniref:VLRF1 domain-containing protein n=2 Tax=Rhizopus microsporus TaxID=58291 RepID=A0A2G4T2L2_RHIZD|nr:uncharacterized protein RHIMIDRAFT_311357 [Rhizopus microsporus ATCC 52813]ORE07839.1 hypothetical protein BCV72DRAFT_272677 [Rhizopus microsporus var. microsporus]PHZ15255.1 hypothetical protein RHIMIDRAFT_311357 [Rhizopus microsporus ATCC 52813]